MRITVLSATGAVKSTSTASATGAAGGDLSGTYPNPAVAAGAISNAKLANVASQIIKGRTSGGTGSPEDLTATQATAILNAMVGDSGSGGTKGLVPAPGAGDAAAIKFLKADGTWSALREILASDRTYYVRTDGSDSNNGLTNTSGGAFLTIQHAYDVVSNNLDFDGHTVTIQVSDGSYPAGLTIATPWVGGPLNILGNTGTPGNVVLTHSNIVSFQISATFPAALYIAGFKDTHSPTPASSILFSGTGTLKIGPWEFGDDGGLTTRISASGPGAYVYVAGRAIKISGSGSIFLSADRGAVIDFYSNTVTITGSPSYSTAFVVADNESLIYATANFFSGALGSGSRYQVKHNSVVVGNGSPTYLPGTTAGTVDTGGYYDTVSGEATMTGDAGSGGTVGLVPAPGAGDAAAGKFLKADGTWTAPVSSGLTQAQVLALLAMD